MASIDFKNITCLVPLDSKFQMWSTYHGGPTNQLPKTVAIEMINKLIG